MLLFFISLIIVIIMHEMAHLLMAKWCKCGVEIFSIGFGKPIFKKKIRKTIYQITPILIGGYCKLKDEFNYSRSKYAFVNLPYRKKLLIVLAGVIINIIFGYFAFILGRYLHNYFLIYLGFISLILGITNAVPFPALDGSYVFLVWLEKWLGKKKGYALMQKICRIGFIILIALNIAFIPIIIHLYISGGL